MTNRPTISIPAPRAVMAKRIEDGEDRIDVTLIYRGADLLLLPQEWVGHLHRDDGERTRG